ncbi:aldo/keto reductase [Limnoraphis robusta Tam1]|uniref:Aldo/keto reductase n=1 Tax=Limnoraphis robusta CCNP1315 TaxID=3110306 RepID=A0ABU5U3Q2_9CYAN|nr:aldo/keto reductase [Limnoraphis robusta]MEA5498917.1 aldo/keto reductase [Limnoraphis robusta BA-68 BA1]MEA5521822.1 aldo/keto reductase [Limnoraphis robusta CCNP1315]MEA5540479.1 aldo/keto reductase [Limnoraphis robusta Tam1]MEA5543982.1 aldo/keto reductase [Limnoraphis robusta CCNP1324]
MQYKQLGDSDLLVSELCLGTMNYGDQNTLEEAEKQLDYAVDQGINFIDTAEMYPAPTRAETQGKTEEYIGHWLSKQRRDQFIIGTKVSGPSGDQTLPITWIRDGKSRIDRQNIQEAVEGSLRRLQTDYIDLYQIHWPDRYVPLFGAPDYDPRYQRETVPILEQLEAFADLVKAGKIRYLGVSNETPWGLCEFCHLAKQFGLPKIVSIQNAFNLTNRVFQIHLAEACHFHNVGLIAYSTLAFGHLSGKYLSQTPAGSRLDLFPGFDRRYHKPYFQEAVKAYVEIAHQYGLTPVQLALAFVRSRWFVASTIIGASTIEQLKENLSCLDIELSPEILAEIDKVHARYPNPTP